MKNFFTALVILAFSSTSLFGEYRMQPVQCTLKKHSNCGAYLYNSNTGATYYCNSEKCKQVMEALEEIGGTEEEVTKGTKKSKIPKKPKKKKKKSKIPKFKKKKSE